MSTSQGIPHLTPRIRIGLRTVLTALGVLAATAVTIVILALPGANHTTATTPSTPSQAATGSPPQIHYLGPQQTRAELRPSASNTDASGPAAGDSAPHFTCLGDAQRCLR